jgi:hypothetical protein
MPDLALPNIAFYYPGSMWRTSDYVKNLLLFFDGVALLVPEYMIDRPLRMDPSLVEGLQEHDLLHILRPETLMDRSAAEALATQLADVIASGALDHLAWDASPYEELSMSRMGFQADEGLAGMLVEELEARSLAQPTRDGVSIPMHPFVRNLVLVLLSQLLRPAGRRAGLDLCPATDMPSIHSSLTELLRLPTMPTAAHVVDLDLQVVGVDLASVPFDELLAFRAEHADAYRAYARDVRRFMRELAVLPEEERTGALDDRTAEITAQALQLQRASRGWWKQPAGVLLGLTGAAWTVGTGDIVGGLLAIGAGAAAALPDAGGDTEAFSYLFQSTRLSY